MQYLEGMSAGAPSEGGASLLRLGKGPTYGVGVLVGQGIALAIS